MRAMRLFPASDRSYFMGRRGDREYREPLGWRAAAEPLDITDEDRTRTSAADLEGVTR